MFCGKIYVYLFVFFYSVNFTLQATSLNYYTGAVVEYHPIVEGKNTTVIAEENAKNFIKFLHTAKENQVDIIVFPENGLFSGQPRPPIYRRSFYLPHSTYLPDYKESKVLCNDSASSVMEVVKTLSCAAKNYSMYVVLNVHEKEECKNCSDGYHLYNTNIVFDRNGALIATYRKYHLFGEVGFDRTPKPKLSIFRTDFGVAFGQFICFDLLFGSPALSLVREKNITDIVFSSRWFSHLPYLSANQIQAGWSYVNDVNFLGSGYNSPVTGNTGSGIYAGRNGRIIDIWSETPTNALLIAKVPKMTNGKRKEPINQNATKIINYSAIEIPTITRQKSISQQKLWSDNLSLFTTDFLHLTNGTHNATVCHGGFCCNFTTDIVFHDHLLENGALYYRYHFAVFNGVLSYAKLGKAGVQVCSIISCLTQDSNNCNKRFDVNTNIVQPVTFNSIVISSTSEDSNNIVHFPLSIKSEMDPLNINEFTFVRKKINETHVSLNYSFTKPYNNLMTFAIYGRNFKDDDFL
ncbi:vanin-like protein 1 [Cotesia glomerata]|uniref:CN hydrolase domain-containing protein n=1 Tax=Cotesia glomerata TaxID=32391 RepID=A0AAV7IDD1_COTGL|nr:vanin-like protein 1 [Cotesia glomerata]KAH0549143.1 hypothetical protein KQX54_006529 [Cotesia glomerata]